MKAKVFRAYSRESLMEKVNKFVEKSIWSFADIEIEEPVYSEYIYGYKRWSCVVHVLEFK